MVSEERGVGVEELVLSDEMIERAARVLDRAYDRHDATLESIAREVIEEAFSGVPLTSYGIGLALQFFDLVICVKDRGLASGAGVYRKGADPNGFDAVGHHLDISWGHEPHYIKRVAVSKIYPPEAPRV